MTDQPSYIRADRGRAARRSKSLEHLDSIGTWWIDSGIGSGIQDFTEDEGETTESGSDAEDGGPTPKGSESDDSNESTASGGSQKDRRESDTQLKAPQATVTVISQTKKEATPIQVSNVAEAVCLRCRTLGSCSCEKQPLRRFAATPLAPAFRIQAGKHSQKLQLKERCADLRKLSLNKGFMELATERDLEECQRQATVLQDRVSRLSHQIYEDEDEAIALSTRAHFTELKKYVCVLTHGDYLFQEGALEETDLDTIKQHETTERASKMLHTLLKKPPALWAQAFLRALQTCPATRDLANDIRPAMLLRRTVSQTLTTSTTSYV